MKTKDVFLAYAAEDSAIRESVKRARCLDCAFLNYDVPGHKYEKYPGFDYCGSHGMHRVDVNGFQENMDNYGGCGYYPKEIQLDLFGG